MVKPNSVAVAFTLGILLFLLVGCRARQDDSASVNEAQGPSISVTAAVDAGVVTVGDLIRYTLEVEYDESLLIDAIVVPETLGDLEVVGSGRNLLRVVRGRGGLVDWIVLRGTEPGSYIIPEIEVTGVSADTQSYAGQGAQVFVEIVSVLPEGAEDIRGLKALEEEASLIVWILVALALMLVALLFWYFKRRARTVEDVVVLSAHERAFRDLEGLRATDFNDLAQLRQYYYSLSAILRGYIEGRFGLNATDLTSQEIARRLGEIGPLEERQESALLSFNSAVDAVKYAAAVPQQAEIEHVYESALGFVEETIPGDLEPMGEAEDDDTQQSVNAQDENDSLATGASVEDSPSTRAVALDRDDALEGDDRFMP